MCVLWVSISSRFFCRDIQLKITDHHLVFRFIFNFLVGGQNVTTVDVSSLKTSQMLNPNMIYLIELLARVSHYPSLSSIAPGRSSKLHPVTALSRRREVFTAQPPQARPCVGVNRRKSLMSSFLLLQQCIACLCLN